MGVDLIDGEAPHPHCLSDADSRAQALEVRHHEVELRRIPDDVLAQAREHSADVVAELAESSELATRIYDSYQAFQEKVEDYHAISEQAYYNARNPEGDTAQ